MAQDSKFPPLGRRGDDALVQFMKQTLEDNNVSFRIERLAQSVALPGGFVHNRLPYQDIVEDKGNWQWSGSPNYEVIVPKTGLYIVSGAYNLEPISHSIGTGSELNIGVDRTGVGSNPQYVVLDTCIFQSSSSFPARLHASRLVPFLAGDVVYPNQRASNAEDTPTAGNSADRRANYFEMTMVLELETIPAVGLALP